MSLRASGFVGLCAVCRYGTASVRLYACGLQKCWKLEFGKTSNLENVYEPSLTLLIIEMLIKVMVKVMVKVRRVMRKFCTCFDLDYFSTLVDQKITSTMLMMADMNNISYVSFAKLMNDEKDNYNNRNEWMGLKSFMYFSPYLHFS